MIWGQTKPPLGSKINWSHPLSKKLVRCWLANEGMGDNVQELCNGKTFDLKLKLFTAPSVTSGWNPASNGKGIIFDGSTNYLEGNNILNETAVSISMWFNLNSATATGRTLIGKRGGTTGAWAIRIEVNSNRITYYRYAGGWNTHIFSVMPTLNKLNHIVFINNGIDKPYIYLNSIRYNDISGVSAAYLPTSAFNIMVGAVYDVGSYWEHFSGLLDNILIYNRALTEKEAAKLYMTPFCFIN